MAAPQSLRNPQAHGRYVSKVEEKLAMQLIKVQNLAVLEEEKTGWPSPP